MLVLVLFHGIGYAAGKIPLDTFLRDIHKSLYSIGRQDTEGSLRPVISNIHVEMHVIVEQDKQGNARYYVLDGIVDDSNVVTQKIAFDLELPQQSVETGRKPAGRRYSTRRRDTGYGSSGYKRYRRYPYPEHYMPDIYPVILFDKHQ